MQVRCEDTKTFVDASKLYKAENGKYYSTETAYKKCKMENIYRNKSIDELIRLLDYENSKNIPTMLFKVIHNCNEFGYQKLYETICKESYTILKALSSKTFVSTYSKFKYIEAIIKNHLKDKSGNDMQEDVTLNNPKQKTKDISSILGGE